MGIPYRIANYGIGAVASSARFILVPTTNLTRLTISSGNHGISIFNIGSGSLIWGGSTIAINSGNVIFVNMRTEWLDVQDGWNVYLLANSLNSLISVTEYGT